MEVQAVKLDLGCGFAWPAEYIGIDISPSTRHPTTGEEIRPDIVHDLNKGIPFGDNVASHIRATHFLEHVKDIHFLLDEIYRVAQNEAQIDIEVPLYEIGFHVSRKPIEFTLFNDAPIVLERLGPMCHYIVFHDTWFEMHLSRIRWQILNKQLVWQCARDDLFYLCLKLRFRINKNVQAIQI